ncbi:MAG: Hsp20/alpha crystallin family protein [Syntrophorhabdaceae bacterium]|nr:Hsp20/alpha crystallin family protein [Syntrophorhabdaceae bacterium]
MAVKLTHHERGGRGLLSRFEDLYPFKAFQEEMTRLMDSFFGSFGIEPLEKKMGVFTPSVDVVDAGKEIKVTAELPGIDEKNVEVSLEKDALIIKGEKKEEREEKKESYYYAERSYGSFLRTIPLPDEVDMDKAKATFKNGVLTVTLPKTEKALKETKKIPIKTA